MNPNFKTNYSFYLVSIQNAQETFIKVGYTSNLERRLTSLEEIGKVSILFITSKYMTRAEAEWYEKEVIRSNLSKKYYPSTRFVGHTECFRKECAKTLELSYKRILDTNFSKKPHRQLGKLFATL